MGLAVQGICWPKADDWAAAAQAKVERMGRGLDQIRPKKPRISTPLNWTITLANGS
jgi:hypothetical protein